MTLKIKMSIHQIAATIWTCYNLDMLKYIFLIKIYFNMKCSSFYEIITKWRDLTLQMQIYNFDMKWKKILKTWKEIEMQHQYFNAVFFDIRNVVSFGSRSVPTVAGQIRMNQLFLNESQSHKCNTTFYNAV